MICMHSFQIASCHMLWFAALCVMCVCLFAYLSFAHFGDGSKGNGVFPLQEQAYTFFMLFNLFTILTKCIYRTSYLILQSSLKMTISCAKFFLSIFLFLPRKK